MTLPETRPTRAAPLHATPPGACAGGRRARTPRVDFGACASALVSAPTISERANCARAVGALAQAQAHTDAMREAVVDAVVALLRAEGDGEAAVAAADALRHLACANDRNRDRARELGAIPLLVAQLRRVAGVAHADMGEGDVAAVTAATAAVRNLVPERAEPRRDPRRRRAGAVAGPRRHRRSAGAAAWRPRGRVAACAAAALENWRRTTRRTRRRSSTAASCRR